MRASLKIRWNSELAISVLFFGPQINFYIASILSMSGLPTITTYIYMVLYAVGLVSYLFTLHRIKSFTLFCAMVISLLFSYLFNSRLSQYMMGSSFFSSPVPVLLCVYFPVFLLTINEMDFQRLIQYFSRLSVVTLVLSIVAFYGYLFVYRSTPSDYMSFAYMMLTPILVCFMKGWKSNKFPFILALIASFIVFIVGCRGAVITLAVFFAIYLIGFYLKGESGKNNLVIKILTLSLIVAVAINADKILNLIGMGLQGVGFTSRTISKLLRGNGAFIESEGRWSIWNQAINNIGFLGKGLFGDRSVIIDEYGHSVYAHNFFLELLVDFGIVLGFVLVIIFIFYVIRAVKIASKSNNELLSKISFIMVSILFAKHMISTSFLISFDFWFYLGIAVNLVLNREYILDGGYDNPIDNGEEVRT